MPGRGPVRADTPIRRGGARPYSAPMPRDRLHVDDLIHPAELAAALDDRLVVRRRHPEGHGWIYNYTPKAATTSQWNDATRRCRGLIVGEDGSVVARPFPKFHNLADHPPGTFDGRALDVFDKLDGSLGIVYRTPDGGVGVSTRGSFDSTQAVAATAHLARQHPTWRPDPGVTVLVEIIGASNRIVVRYDTELDLVAVGAIDILTGADLDVASTGWPGRIAARLASDISLEELVDLARDDTGTFPDAEGWVIRVVDEPGTEATRVKLKRASYVAAHTRITMISTITIWEHLRGGAPIDALLDGLPDEVFGWTLGVARRLQEQVDQRVAAATAVATDDRLRSLPRAELARVVLAEAEDPSAVFAILDGKDPRPRIWSHVRPDHETPG